MQGTQHEGEFGPALAETPGGRERAGFGGDDEFEAALGLKALV